MNDTAATGSGIILILMAVAFLLFALVSTVFWIWSIVDAAKRPDAQWDAAGQNKTVWVVAIVVVGAVGSLLYLLIPRPALKRIEAASGTVFDPTNFGVPEGGLTYGHDGFEQPNQP